MGVFAFFALLSLVGFAFIVLVVWAWRGVGEQEAAELRGAAFGASATDEACVAETIRQVRASEAWILLAEGEFLRSCLHASKPSPAFCAGVPLPSDQERGFEWRLERCKSASLELDDSTCSAIYWPVQNYCVEQKALGAEAD